MKKVIFILIFFIGTCFMNAGDNTFSLTVGAGMRYVAEKDLFEEVYGDSHLAYSVDLGYKFGKSLQLFFHSDYLSVKGELTYTKEETTLTIIPLELGLRYQLGQKKLFPYIGAGAGYYMYKEDNPIDTVDEKQFGFFGEGGLKFYFVKSFFLDLKVKYVSLKVDGEEGDINIGGMALIGGVGISF